MQKRLQRLVGLVLVVGLCLTASPGSVRAETVEQRMQALEARIVQLERLLALTALDVPGLVAKASPAVVSIYMVDEDDQVSSEGTGFLTTDDGLIITNEHVVEADLTIKVKFADGKVQVAEPLLVDPFLDLALLQVEGEGFPRLKFAEKLPVPGEPVVVIGNAWGYSNSVTAGIVSGVNRPDPYHMHHYPSLQTDAAINHGNSGGPILNARGEVVAVATWTELKSNTDGISFGIPVDQIAAALTKFAPGRGIVRPWLGAAIREPYWAAAGLPNDLGLVVGDVHAKGAAYRAGMRRGDWVTHVGTTPVNYLMDLRKELERHKPDATVSITVERRDPNGGDKWIKLKLTAKLGEYSTVVPALVPDRYDSDRDDLF